MSDIPPLLEIEETFSLLDDWEGRYAYLIDLGRKLPEFPDEARNDNNIVNGCTSQVWMVLSNNNGCVEIKADSDAHIVRGLIALVISIYSGQNIGDIKKIEMDQIFSELGLSEHLSPNRRNGFFSMVERVKLFN